MLSLLSVYVPVAVVGVDVFCLDPIVRKVFHFAFKVKFFFQH